MNILTIFSLTVFSQFVFVEMGLPTKNDDEYLGKTPLHLVESSAT